jgi:hypothetical protein
MDLLAIAKAERDRLNKVIALLESEASTSSLQPKAKLKPPAQQWTDAKRKALSRKMKRLWTKKQKVSAKPPKP